MAARCSRKFDQIWIGVLTTFATSLLNGFASSYRYFSWSSFCFLLSYISSETPLKFILFFWYSSRNSFRHFFLTLFFYVTSSFFFSRIFQRFFCKSFLSNLSKSSIEDFPSSFFRGDSWNCSVFCFDILSLASMISIFFLGFCPKVFFQDYAMDFLQISSVILQESPNGYLTKNLSMIFLKFVYNVPRRDPTRNFSVFYFLRFLKKKIFLNIYLRFFKKFAWKFVTGFLPDFIRKFLKGFFSEIYCEICPLVYSRWCFLYFCMSFF